MRNTRSFFPALAHLGLAVLGMLAVPAIASAHGVRIQSQAASAIAIQATYDSNQPMADAQVQVFSPGNLQTPVFTGTTDSEGRFLFLPDAPGDWEVSVRQAGHGEIVVIPVSAAGELAVNSQSTGLTGLQRGIVIGAVIWGCVGTALYFYRGKH